MISRVYLSLTLLALIGCSITALDARPKKTQTRSCQTSKSCKSLHNSCQCYCSGIGAFRDKKDEDKPVFVENDPNGVYCYCKQWDLDAFPFGERP